MKSDFDVNIIDGLRNKYNRIHPLIFKRSLENADTVGELFDILDEFEYKYPVMWSDSKKRWIWVNDLLQSSQFNLNQIGE